MTDEGFPFVRLLPSSVGSPKLAATCTGADLAARSPPFQPFTGWLKSPSATGSAAGADLAARSPPFQPFTGWLKSPSATGSEPTRGKADVPFHGCDENPAVSERKKFGTVPWLPPLRGSCRRRRRATTTDEGMFCAAFCPPFVNFALTGSLPPVPGRTLPPVLRLSDRPPDALNFLWKPTPNPPRGRQTSGRPPL
jgi:hypothetical protein